VIFVILLNHPERVRSSVTTTIRTLCIIPFHVITWSEPSSSYKGSAAVPFQGAGAILVLRRHVPAAGSNLSESGVLHFAKKRPIRVGDHRGGTQMVGQHPIQHVILAFKRPHLFMNDPEREDCCWKLNSTRSFFVFLKEDVFVEVYTSLFSIFCQ
jgi:hypothetical protein